MSETFNLILSENNDVEVNYFSDSFGYQVNVYIDGEWFEPEFKTFNREDYSDDFYNGDKIAEQKAKEYAVKLAASYNVTATDTEI